MSTWDMYDILAHVAIELFLRSAVYFNMAPDAIASLKCDTERLVNYWTRKRSQDYNVIVT